MDKVIETAKELRALFDETPEMKEYIKLKEIYEKDQTLSKMRNDIARLESEGKIEEKKNLVEIYNSHPLVSNFNLAKEEVYNLLQTVKQILSD